MTLPEPAELVPGLDRWRDLPAAQQPTWPDRPALDAVLTTLSTVPPIVAPAEIDALRAQLADVAQGKAFLLQG
ncbi:MAG: 3-deoxy-7-phosphoheptulonate synthase, partial [Blastococcus sp.]